MQLKPTIGIHQSSIGQRKSTQTSYDGHTSLDNNMKHKAPCSTRGYSGLRESGPLNIDAGEGDGDVGEDGGGVGEDRGDDDGPRQRSDATGSKGERAPLILLLP